MTDSQSRSIKKIMSKALGGQYHKCNREVETETQNKEIQEKHVKLKETLKV